jgi:hypothetical protein
MKITSHIFHLLLTSCSLLIMQTAPSTGQSAGMKPRDVKIVKKNNTWQLYCEGKPFYIKGVVGSSYLELVKECGGNSVRTGWRSSDLDELKKLGLSALVNLPANAERYGMDYSDTSSVRKQQDALLEIVRKIKDHPAVLMWAIGNELDYIPQTKPFNPKVWNAVNSLAKAVHKIDPHHPVMTVIGTSMMHKVADIVKRCPDLDLLGVNSYGDIYTISDTLNKYGWMKPYVISEWGPSGYWEVKKTPWGAPYEQTGREKLDCYRDKYLKAILKNQDQCLGSYVFYWEGFKQETTHTWFCLFDINGNKSPMVELMCSMWSSRNELTGIPVLDSMQINSQPSKQALYLEAGKEYSASAFCSSNNENVLSWSWEIRPEAQYAAYAGQGEKVPQPLPGLENKKAKDIVFFAPEMKGAYRLFVYVYDGKGHFSTVNIPFYVQSAFSLPDLLPDTSTLGRYTSRTMHLLYNSTPENRNTVRILVYGQSISAQEWWLEVKRTMERRFPYANLIMENKAIGGFASQMLYKTVEMDVSSFYPDLVLLHIYGSNQFYDSVLHTIRSRTASEIAITTDHYTGENEWSDTMSYYILPTLAEKYKCDLINIRDPWKKYLNNRQIDPARLLTDQVHLNDSGNMLMAELIKPLFTYKPKYPADPFGLSRTYYYGKDFTFKGDTLYLQFCGNKAELITDPNGSTSGETLKVLLDGQPPSTFQGCYFISRPYNDSGKKWPWELPAWIRIRHTRPWVSEQWTCVFTEAKIPYLDFRFKIQGSITGKDGYGRAGRDFVSKSGRVIIDKNDAESDGDWHLNRSYKVLKTIVNKGDTVMWKTFSISTDNYVSEKSLDTTIENRTTLFQGVPNTKHTLTLVKAGEHEPPVSGVRIYRPYWNRSDL